MRLRLIGFCTLLLLLHLNRSIISQSSFDSPCQQLLLDVEEYIYNKLNYCVTDADCINVSGICPLSPYFIINKEHAWEMDWLSTLTTQKCRRCKYDLPILPRDLKIECRNNKGCPSLKFLEYASYFNLNCEQIISFYGKDLIGQSSDHFEFRGHMFRIVSERDTTTIDPREIWNLRLVEVRIDDLGIIKDLICND